MMRKLLPAPLLSLALLVMWLLLVRSYTLGQVLLGALAGWAMPWFFASLRPHRPRIRRPLVLARYILTVGWDVLLSNLQVLRGVLRVSARAPAQDGFVTIPLQLRDPSALAALAMVTTVVPGTVWCELARDGSALLLHVWDLEDKAAFIARYKQRYEQPLIEIFES